MLTIKQSKEITGEITLPYNPDYLFLSFISTITLDKRITISPLIDSPLVQDIIKSLSSILTIESNSTHYTVFPKDENQSSIVTLVYEHIPYKDFSIPYLLATGKSLAIEGIPSPYLERLTLLSYEFDLSIESTIIDDTPIYTLNIPENYYISSYPLSEKNILFYFALAYGTKASGEYTLPRAIPTPFKHLFPALGYKFTMKQENQTEDSLTQRLLFSPKQKNKSTSVRCTFDFSQSSKKNIVLTLPGDDILGAFLLLAKVLIPKGTFRIVNLPMESWNNTMSQLIRKFGVTFDSKESQKTSFGAMGIISIKKSIIAGRKIDCTPLFQYDRILPYAVVLSNFATGQSVFRSLEPLRDESVDHIELLLQCIRLLGGRHGEMPDGMVIDQAKQYDGFDLPESYSAAVNSACVAAALKSNGTSTVNDIHILHRWPQFTEILQNFIK